MIADRGPSLNGILKHRSYIWNKGGLINKSREISQHGFILLIIIKLNEWFFPVQHLIFYQRLPAAHSCPQPVNPIQVSTVFAATGTTDPPRQ